MSMTFTKLFSSITESTIWVEDHETRIVWIAMLAMADRKGRVWGSIPGLANRARVSVEGCRKAICTFLSPDPDSRTKEEEGRRIREIDGGWQLINYFKYREIRDQETVREQTAKRVAAYRKRNVTRSNAQKHQAEAEAEAYTEADSPAGGRAPRAKAKRQLPADFDLTPERQAVIRELSPDADPFAEFSQFSDHHRSRGTTMLDWDAAWRTWCRNSKKFSKGAGSDRKTQSPLERIQRAYSEERR